ncbi:MAG: RNA polymerase sigma factor [Gammaproteobacteria bacterium]|nr:RNA polymerase sigma factor [Gammaproteobacteria bacterium]
MRNRLENQLDGLSRYAYCLTGHFENARDLVQNCAVKALAARKVPSDEKAFRAWLFKILRNDFLDSLRKQSTEDRLLRELMNDSQIEGNNLYEPNVYSIEQRRINILAVHEGLAKLKPGQREILVLTDMVGFSYNEVADLLQVPVGTVMSRISRARNALLKEVDGAGSKVATVTHIGKRK